MERGEVERRLRSIYGDISIHALYNIFWALVCKPDGHLVLAINVHVRGDSYLGRGGKRGERVDILILDCGTTVWRTSPKIPSSVVDTFSGQVRMRMRIRNQIREGSLQIAI